MPRQFREVLPVFIKRHRLLVQFAEYLVGSGIAFWGGYYGTFAICYSVLNWNWLPAKFLSDVVSFGVNFLLQRYWAFGDPRLKNTEGQVRIRYITLAALNFLIDYAIVGGLKAAGVSPYIGQLVAATFFLPWNYLWFRFWVFKAE